MNYDVIIIGSGISGLSAAIMIKLKNPSYKVLIVEWNDKIGGNSKMATSGISLVNYAKNDTPAKFLKDVKENNHITKYIAHNSKYILYLLNQMGIHFNTVTKTGLHSVARTFSNNLIETNIGSYIIGKMYDYAKNINISFLLSTKIVSANYSLKNVIIHDDKNNMYKTNNLIIATGGYSANTLMRIDKHKNLPTSNGDKSLGIGINIGLMLGGEFIATKTYLQIHPTAFITPFILKHQKIPSKIWLVPEFYRAIGAKIIHPDFKLDQLISRNKISESLINIQNTSNIPIKFKIPQNADNYKITKKYIDEGLIILNNESDKNLYKYMAYISPCVHYTLSGLYTNSKQQITKKGGGGNVYAVGETTKIFNNERICGLGLASSFASGLIVSMNF
jgi:aspartate oxidase